MIATGLLLVGMTVVALSDFNGDVQFPGLLALLVDALAWYVIGAYIGVFPTI